MSFLPCSAPSTVQGTKEVPIEVYGIKAIEPSISPPPLPTPM